MKTKQWTIKWRGKITRDVGADVETANTMGQAKEQFQARYPMREIVAVTRVLMSTYQVFEVADGACALLGSFTERRNAQYCAKQASGRGDVFRLVYKDGAYDGSIAGCPTTNEAWTEAQATVQRMRMEKSSEKVA